MLSNSSLVQNKGARWLRCSPVPKALCALIGALLLTPLVAHAQDASPVTLGILMPKQGVLGEIGRDGQRGAMMAIEDADSKVLNRPVKVVWADDPNPQAAQENFSKMVDADKVVAIVGGISSASTLASSATAKQRKIPFVSVTAATNELTGKLCNRYTFRTFTPISVSARALEGPMLEKGKKWYFIVPNYATGQDIYRDMHADLLKAGGEEVGYDNVAMDNSDFSSFILKIRQAKPDAVIVG
ncbi:MAG: ABC transporter substrate-binding protein, partial [Janthinobacterium lividum]